MCPLLLSCVRIALVSLVVYSLRLKEKVYHVNTYVYITNCKCEGVLLSSSVTDHLETEWCWLDGQLSERKVSLLWLLLLHL